MSKRAHELKATVGNRRPRRIMFFDTETNQERKGNGETHHTLRVGIAQFCTLDDSQGLDVRSSLIFHTPSEFVAYLEGVCKKKSTTYLVAHNLVFDLSVCGIFKELAILGWELTSWYSKGMVSIFRWKDGERRLIGLDNGNFFQGKLEKWGALLGYPKLPISFEHTTDEDLTTYCQRDVEIMVRLWQLWLSFLDDHNCGSFKPTVASTAFNTWRHRFLTEKVHIHNEGKATDLERASFRGGRTECLWVGNRQDGPFYYLDVNNMYGWILSTCSFPAGLYSWSDTISLYKLAYKLERFACIARVTVEIDEPYFPLIIDTHTTYPTGTFMTTLTTPELKLCIDRGWLQAVHECTWYREAQIFGDYVDEFSDLRSKYERENNPGFAKICKLLVNGLYGKFGQRGLHQEIIGECEPSEVRREKVLDYETGKVWDQVWLAGRIWREWQEGESYHSFPAIAAHVTAYARLRLFDLVRRVAPGHVFYMDTDSLIVDAVGYQDLASEIKPGVLGALKVELESPFLEIHAPKDYAMLDRVKLKGIKATAVEIEPGVYKQTHWLKLAGLIRAGVTEGYITKEIVKHQSRIIHSGLVLPTGWVQSPHLQSQVP
ncbi:hypothetical protein LCGC14_1116680 [marine sediment metagenome]|uniref:DNA-directed DNA polymerase n=1 Tax=marine sediment metagenome TaxID=412755 RepID=A0A0F9QAZ3_9ZZZZ